MAIIQGLISVTVPGTHLDVKSNSLLTAFTKALEDKGIDGKFADIIAGWGCLLQEWFEFETEIDTDYDWVRLTCFTDNEWYGVDGEIGWRMYFEMGLMLMMIHYVTVDENGEKVYTPHH